MNIFYLSHNPVRAAMSHCDKHVVKMILEYAQLLSTAHHMTGSGHDGLYKCTHKNHPSAVWTRSGRKQYRYVFMLWKNLLEEYNLRYGKHHKTGMLYDDLAVYPDLPDTDFTVPPQCMPDEYKRDDTVLAYRLYYKHGKADILQYRKNRPKWLGE